MEYEPMRHFADTWGLAFLVAVFAVVVARALRPGARKSDEESAQIPLKED